MNEGTTLENLQHRHHPLQGTKCFLSPKYSPIRFMYLFMIHLKIPLLYWTIYEQMLGRLVNGDWVGTVRSII